MLFDQWAAVYSHYTVLGAKITVTPTPPSTGSVATGFYGVNVSTSTNAVTTDFTSTENILESPYTTPVKITGNINSSLDMERATISSKFDTKKFFGIKNPIDGSAYSAAVTDNPGQGAYFRIFLAPVAGNTPAASYFLVELIYDVVFRDPKAVDGS